MTTVAESSRDPDERRVALVADSVGRLRSLELDVLVQTGAGGGAWFSDDAAHTSAGAEVCGRELNRRG